MAVLMPEPQGTALGLTTVYADQYDPKLLFPISRNIGRDAIGDHDFIGTDIWRMYEFSWLNANGLPQAAEVDVFVPASSPSIIESNRSSSIKAALHKPDLRAVPRKLRRF